jgi:hypothetical protein
MGGQEKYDCGASLGAWGPRKNQPQYLGKRKKRSSGGDSSGRLNRGAGIAITAAGVTFIAMQKATDKERLAR